MGRGEYDIIEVLSTAGGWQLCRINLRDSAPAAAIARIYRGSPAGAAEASRQAKAELALLGPVASPAILRPVRVSGTALIFEDFDGVPLRHAIAGRAMTIPAFLTAAIQLADALGAAHALGLVHRALHPDNILYDARADRLKLTGFYSAVHVSRHQIMAEGARLDARSGPYLAPEQTGRVNRLVDYRTDYYGLGVVLYEMLTSSPPFVSDDVLQLVYMHLAQEPERVEAARRDVPAVVGDIIAKLLAKSSESRYQSTFGLDHDLRTCQQRFAEKGHIAPFLLGQRDVAQSLNLPEKPYGREQEAQRLTEQFHRVSQGGVAVTFISGAPGIGKSTLVQELHRPVARAGGYFVSSKFDQVQRDVPYTGIVAALTAFLKMIGGEEDARLQRWKVTLRAALGPNGGVVADILPEIVNLLGPQQPAVPLPAAAAQERFNVVLQQFIAVLATPSHPLVMFLDDLQWADIASLKLLELVLTSPQSAHLLVLGAYRDNEVVAGHPLRATLVELRRQGVELNEMTASPLALPPTQELLADMLHSTRQEVGELAETLHQRTGGNPFFLLQMLQELERGGHVAYSRKSGRWEWDPVAIRGVQLASNVVDLVMGRLRELSAGCVALLKWAAVMGGKFDLAILSEVSDVGRDRLLACLREALDAQMVVMIDGAERLFEAAGSGEDAPLNAISCKFCHDRVQQAAAALTDEARLTEMGLRIGQAMLQRYDAEQVERSLFDIVGHLNPASHMLTAPQRLDLVALDLRAGRRANASVAHSAAYRLLCHAIALLPPDAWTTHHALALELHDAAGEAASGAQLNGEAETLLGQVLQHGQTPHEKATAYAVLADLRMTQSKPSEGIELMREALVSLGESWPTAALKAHVARQLLRLKMRLPKRDDLRSLADRKGTEDARIKLIYQFYRKAIPSCFQVNVDLAVYCSLRVINLVLEHGPTAEVSAPYNVVGMVLGSGLGDYEAGYALSRVAIDLTEKFDVPALRSQAHFVAGFANTGWWRHASECVVEFREAERYGFQFGDLLDRRWAMLFGINVRLFIGEPLDELRVEAQRVAEAIAVESPQLMPLPTAALQFIDCLQQVASAQPWTLDGPAGTQQALLDQTQKSGFAYCNQWVSLWACRLALFAGDYRRAVDLTAYSAKYLEASFGMLLVSDHYFLRALAILGAAGQNAYDRRKALAEARRCHAKLATWAKHCPENFRHKEQIVAASMAYTGGDWQRAGALCEMAIEQASEQGYRHDAAWAYELAAQVAKARGAKPMMRAYAAHASEAYQAWGAHRKALLVAEAFGVEAAKPRAMAGGAQFDLSAVIHASEAMARQSSDKGLAAQIARTVMENTGAQKAALILESGGAWRVWALAETHLSHLVAGRPLDACAEVLPVALLRGAHYGKATLVANQASDFSRLDRDTYLVGKTEGSLLCVPITHQAEVLGLMYLENTQVPQGFPPERVALVRLLAAQAATSIVYARHRAELDARVASRTQELREAQESLLRVQKSSTERRLAGGFAHEIRNILGSAQLSLAGVMDTQLATGAPGPSVFLEMANHAKAAADAIAAGAAGAPETRGHLVKIIRAAKPAHEKTELAASSVARVLRLTAQILEYAKLGESAPRSDVVPLAELLDDIVQHTQEDLQRANTTLLMQLKHREMCALGTSEHFYTVFDNLIRNARDAVMGAEPPVGRQITIQDDLMEDTYVVRIQDNGVGIPQENYGKLFEAFFSTKPATGTGLGLGNVRKALELYGATVSFDSVVNEGTTFSVSLPRARLRSGRGAKQ